MILYNNIMSYYIIICNVNIVNQHVKPLNVSKAMIFCNVHNLNVHMINSISRHIKSLNAGKSNCSSNLN